MFKGSSSVGCLRYLGSSIECLRYLCSSAECLRYHGLPYNRLYYIFVLQLHRRF